MIEIPEAIVLSEQLNQTIKGKRVSKVIAAASPHKFAWYSCEPGEYDAMLAGKRIGEAAPCAGRIEIKVDDIILRFAEGINLRFYESGEKPPVKHQLMIAFEDGSALVATVAMYGGMWCIPQYAPDDGPYTKAAKEAIPPLSDQFDYTFFKSLINEKSVKMSAKAFLATEQRIPGLGNGALQDILLNAKIHPKTNMNTLTEKQLRGLFDSIKSTLAEMVRCGGRDTEKDLFGNPGGYKTKLSKNSLPYPCQNCGGTLKKEAYLGGSIYFCESCQNI